MPQNDSNTKQANKPTIGTTIYCDVCKKEVNVGTGGEKNFIGHCKSAKHKAAMERQKQGQTLLNFLKPKPVPIQSAAPKPSTLKNKVLKKKLSPRFIDIRSPIKSPLSRNPSTRSVIADDPEVIKPLRRLISQLPLSVREGQPGDPLAGFAEKPIFLEKGYDLWENMADRLLNNLIGYGKTPEELVCLVCRGKYGMDGFAQWLKALICDGNVPEAVIEPKLANLLLAMKTLAVTETVETKLPPMISEDGLSSDEGARSLPSSMCMDGVGRGTDSVGCMRSDGSADSVVDDDIDISVTEQDSNIGLQRISDVCDDPKKNARSTCLGLPVKLPTGQDPWLSYPFAIHGIGNFPWVPNVEDSRLYLRSHECQKTSFSVPCFKCVKLNRLQIISRIIERIENGSPEHTPWFWLSMSALYERLRRTSAQLQAKKLQSLNAGRSVAYRNRVIEDYKRFILAVSSGNVQRVDALVRTALHNGLGLPAILERMDKATRGLYKPRSYDEQAYHLGQLLRRLGGNTVAKLAYDSLGAVPSIRSLQRKALIQQLNVSIGYPSSTDIAANIRSMFPDSFQKQGDGNIVGYVLMIDEIAIENRLRYDSARNLILGTCREHSDDHVSLEFQSLDEADIVLDNLKEGNIHFAAEATVIAIGVLHEDFRLSTARPILVSGKCKKESAGKHAMLLRRALKACKDEEGRLGGSLYSIATDGERKRGKALWTLTMMKPLEGSSPIYKLLHCLPLLNQEVGANDETLDKDYRHIGKRGRNTSIRPRGVDIGNVTVTPVMLERHLLDSGVAESRVRSLLQPNDKQDVPLAYGFLVTIAKLPPPPPDKPATYIQVRKALNALGEFWMALITPYTDQSMSLREQLINLSKAAHTCLALYILSKDAFMPVQLYADIMHMIKNVYFSVAKAKIHNPKGKFYIILLGTDRLEVQFGLLRSMIGNDANADILQVASRLTAAAESSMLLSMHPEWSRGPRRLQLPSLQQQGDIIHQKTDHLSPASWTGDVSVSDVILQTCWTKGRNDAQILLNTILPGYNFRTLIEAGNIDILRPFGELIEEGVEIGDENTDEDAPAQNRVSQNHNVSGTPDTIDLEPDLEDIVGAMNVEDDEDEGDKKKPFVMIEGKAVHKASVLRLFSHPISMNGPHSLDRLKRVRGYTRFDTVPTPVQEGDSELSGTTILVNDPIASLIRVNGDTFLAILMLSMIKREGKAFKSITTTQLQESNLEILGQLLPVVPQVPVGEERYDWNCLPIPLWSRSGQFISISPSLIEVLNPVTLVSENGEPSFHFRTPELLATLKLLHEKAMATEGVAFPNLTVTNDFPYKVEGRVAFMCEREDEDIPLGYDQDSCDRCQRKGPKLKTGAKRIAHMSAHILHDPTLRGKSNICAFCLRVNATCQIYLRQTKGQLHLDIKSSTCPRMKAFSMKMASNYSDKSPCTNVPVACPLCPKRAKAIWKYNLEDHIISDHLNANASDYQEIWKISGNEIDGMSQLWSTIQNSRKSGIKQGKLKLIASEAHSSRLALRGVTNSNKLAGDESESDAISSSQESSGNDSHQESNVSVSEIGDGADETSGANCDSGTRCDPNALLIHDSVFHDEEIGTRQGRRKRRIRSFLSICFCNEGESINPRDIDATSAKEKGLVECVNKGCESQWYHLACFGPPLEFAPKDWKCPQCRNEKISSTRAVSGPRKKVKKGDLVLL